MGNLFAWCLYFNRKSYTVMVNCVIYVKFKVPYLRRALVRCQLMAGTLARTTGTPAYMLVGIKLAKLWAHLTPTARLSVCSSVCSSARIIFGPERPFSPPQKLERTFLLLILVYTSVILHVMRFHTRQGSSNPIECILKTFRKLCWRKWTIPALYTICSGFKLKKEHDIEKQLKKFFIPVLILI